MPEHEPQPQNVEPPTEPDVGLELEAPLITNIEALPEALGFDETDELSRLGDELVKAMLSKAEAEDLVTRYYELAEAIVNQREGEDFAKAQIGLIVRMGCIRRAGGSNGACIDDLTDAHTYARNMRLDDIASVVETAIRAIQSEIDKGAEVTEPLSEQLAQACAEVLSAEDLAELAVTPLDDVLGYAFALLLENGVDDPEAYLRDKGVLV